MIDLSTVEVRREWRPAASEKRIDICLIDDSNDWVGVIENKVKSSEHGTQLKDYAKLIDNRFDDSLFLYLTPRGERPSHEKYVPVSYETIIQALEGVVEERENSLTSRAQGLLEDYMTIVKRHVIMDSEVAKMCRRIYKEHHEAIDLILESRFDTKELATEYIEEVLEEIEGDFDVVVDRDEEVTHHFWPEAIDVEGLKRAEGWTDSEQIIQFSLKPEGSSVKLFLFLGPGDDTFRERVYGWLQDQDEPFSTPRGDTPSDWQTLYSAQIISLEKLEMAHLEGDREQAVSLLNNELRKTLESHLDELVDGITGSGWYQSVT